MPRMTSPDGNDHLEVSNAGEVTSLRAQGWTESAALTKEVREADESAAERRLRDPRLVENKRRSAPPMLRPDENPTPAPNQDPPAS